MIRDCAHEACGKAFETKRSDARFCSAGCRAAASRARRAGVGPGSGPTCEGSHPDLGPPDADKRLRALEERVMDLESDVEAAESERDGLRQLRARVEAAVARATAVVEEARRAAEAAARAAVAPMQKEQIKAQGEAVKRRELAELRIAVERVERRLAGMEERIEIAPVAEERLRDVEQEVATLTEGIGRLLEELDTLVGAFAGR